MGHGRECGVSHFACERKKEMSFAFCFFASSSMIGAGGGTFHPTALRLRNTKYVLLVCSMDRTTSGATSTSTSTSARCQASSINLQVVTTH